MADTFPDKSPRWGTITKLVVAILFVAVLAWLFIQFRNFLGPLLLALIVTYLIYPLARKIILNTTLPWRLTITLLYLLIVIVLVGLLTLGGLALFNQLQSLVDFLTQAVNNLPETIANLQNSVIQIGSFRYELKDIDLAPLTEQILGMVNPALSRLGSLLGLVVSNAASLVGWVAFILLISYFILAETEGIPSRLLRVHVPGYDLDLRRFRAELGRIWNSFFRGQLTVIAIAILIYTIVLGVLGVRYYFGLALLAGTARFIPYVGALITWTTYGLVTYFQGTTAFGMTQFGYTALIIGLSLVIDNILDNMVSPRIMASALRVHPAAVLIAALVGANILGLVGVVLAAPVMATLKLVVDYSLRKLFDLDPWEQLDNLPPPRPYIPPWTRMRQILEMVISWLKRFVSHIRQAKPGDKQPPGG